MKICAYCQLEKCNCSAEEYINKPKENGWKIGEPFAYMTYVVWALHDRVCDRHLFRFYKGIELIGDVEVSWLELQEAGISEFIDPMPYIFERFEKECLTKKG